MRPPGCPSCVPSRVWVRRWGNALHLSQIGSACRLGKPRGGNSFHLCLPMAKGKVVALVSPKPCVPPRWGFSGV